MLSIIKDTTSSLTWIVVMMTINARKREMRNCSLKGAAPIDWQWCNASQFFQRYFLAYYIVTKANRSFHDRNEII
jgi:hypothetical protein